MNPTNSANIQSVLSQLRQYQAIAEGNNVENLNNKKVDNEYIKVLRKLMILDLVFLYLLEILIKMSYQII